MRDATRRLRLMGLLSVLSVTSAASFAQAQQTHPTAAHSRRPTMTALDQPMAQSWRARREWDAQMEREYSSFIVAIGRGVEAGRCHTLARCLNDPRVNPLFETGMRPLRFRADCADTPYTLRAWFAYRKGLPFAYVRHMAGRGHDVRYLHDARPIGVKLWTEFATPRQLFESIGSDVHSGYFRTAADADEGDFYQTSVDRRGIRPGTMYYNPNGHVLVVYDIRPDGDILMFDGHPDNSLSHRRFSERLPIGTAAYGGGFKNFRPFFWDGAGIVRVPNASIPDFGGSRQFDRTRYASVSTRTFHDWIRSELATVPSTVMVATTTLRARCEPMCATGGGPRRRVRILSTPRAVTDTRRRLFVPSAPVSPPRSPS